MSSYIWTPLLASLNHDADHVAAQITSLTPALYHTLGLGTPSPNQTCVLTSTKADLVHASPALTSTGVTSQDVQQPTPGKTIQNLPTTERTDLSRLQFLTIPPEDAPKYLSHLSPPTPIDIAKLASYLQGHPDPLAVKHLISGFSQGSKLAILVQGPPKNILIFPVLKATHWSLTKTC